jgi:hypothetical protein
VSKNTLDFLFTIIEKYDATNYTTGVNRYSGGKMLASNATAQAKLKQQLVLTQTSNIGHAQNP